MATPTKSSLYVDTSVLIDAATVEVQNPNALDYLTEILRKDVWFTRQILAAARVNDLDVFTSAITIAECTYAGEKPPNQKVKDHFRAILLSGKCLKLIQPDIFVCENARDLLWDHGISLKGADAIHIASALQQECEEFLTTDQTVLNKAADIRKLGLGVIHPSETKLLPDEYRQGLLLQIKKGE